MGPLLSLLMPLAQAAPLSVGCAWGCLPGGDETPSLLYHAADQDIVLEWTSVDEPGTLTLRAGDPMTVGALPDRGPLEFTRERGLWRARARFSSDELKAGTLVTALLEGEGRGQRIVGWWVWRPLTPEELEAQRAAPDPWSGWELGLAPAAIRTETGGRALPVGTRAGKADPWWAPGPGEAWTDLDLDGPASGAPGIGVAVSSVWASSADDPGWRDEVKSAITGDDGRDVAFEDLRWTEAPARAVEAGPGQTVELRAYYVAVTLHTQASVAQVDRDQLRGWGWRCGPACLTHETSAALKAPDELPLWSGYNPRLHTRDAELLALLQRQVDEEGGVPGLDAIRRGDGDGGATRVDLGLVAALQPWTGQESLRPGIVAIDVVGNRAGVGEIRSEGRETLPALPRLLAGIFGDSGAHEVDLADLPEGWSAWGASARVLSQAGLLRPMDDPALAQKGAAAMLGWSADGVQVKVDNGEGIGFPDQQRVVVSASLRAGALARRGTFGRTAELVPVNAFAQVVLRLTVASPRALAVDEAVVVPDRKSEGGEDLITEAARERSPLPSWGQRGLWAAAGLLGLGLIAYTVGQVRVVVDSVNFGRSRRR